MARGSERATRLALAQGAYFVVTGLWPILHLSSFYAVTGPKREGWLVKTVGAVIAVIGSTLLLAAFRARPAAEVAWLGASSAAALGTVDLIYALRGRISPVYLLDAVVEAAVIGGWTLRRA